jgi:hypothetical protein
MSILIKLFYDNSTAVYKRLRGCIIETLTIIADTIDKETYLPYFE